jgi:hypothetical protein
VGKFVCIKILVGKPEEKRQPGRPRLRWENILKLTINKMGVCELDLTASGWHLDEPCETVMVLRVP